MLFRRKPKPDRQDIPLHVGGVRVKPSARARRISLRVDMKEGDVVFTWPLKGRVTLEKAERFVAENRDWIERQGRRASSSVPFAAGTALALMGREHVIAHEPGRGLTRLEGGRLVVHGRAEHLPRRVRDFLKAEAARVLQALSDEKAARIGLKPSPVRIRDPKTRWGSCGPDGGLMYSWRILLAPPEVMDYLVAHEVAHRVHMNHGRRFWALCAELAEGDAMASRRWLRREGKQLHAYK